MKWENCKKCPKHMCVLFYSDFTVYIIKNDKLKLTAACATEANAFRVELNTSYAAYYERTYHKTLKGAFNKMLQYDIPLEYYLSILKLKQTI